MRSWWGLVVVCAAVLGLSWFGTFGGATWWPWEPVRICVLLVAAVAVAAGPRTAAVLTLVTWAFVASPLAVEEQDLGFVEPQGNVLATGIPSGPFLLRAGSFPTGATVFEAADKHYVNGEGSDADSELVAWSLVWLPWPHLDRTEIIGLGGNVIDFWAYPDSVEVRRNRQRLAVTGTRYDDASHMEQSESRAIALRRTTSLLTLLGWLVLLLLLLARLTGTFNLRRAQGD